MKQILIISLSILLLLSCNLQTQNKILQGNSKIESVKIIKSNKIISKEKGYYYKFIVAEEKEFTF